MTQSSKPAVSFCEITQPFSATDFTPFIAAQGLGLTLPNIAQADNLPQYSNFKALYWLDEMSGSVAHDLTGNGNDAALSGHTWVAEGVQFAGAANNGLVLPFPLGAQHEVIALYRGDSSGGDGQTIYGGFTYQVRGLQLTASSTFNTMSLRGYNAGNSSYAVATGANTPKPLDAWRITSMWQQDQNQTQSYAAGRTISASATLTAADAGTAMVIDCTAGAVVITLPASGAVAQNGGAMFFRRIGPAGNALTFALQGSDTWTNGTPPSLTQNGSGIGFHRNGAGAAFITDTGGAGMTFDTGTTASTSTASQLAGLVPPTENFCFGCNSTGSGIAITPFKGKLSWLAVWDKAGLNSSTSYPERATVLAFLASKGMPTGAVLGS